LFGSLGRGKGFLCSCVCPCQYPTGIKYTAKDVAALPITHHDFHGEWNYTVNPTRPNTAIVSVSAPASGQSQRIKLYETGQVLYALRMATMKISTAREHLPQAIETARTEAVFLERYGRPTSVLISPERYEQLMAALEDAEDVEAFDAAMAEESPNIPWEQVKADLGWV
jgi:PHD/YefM family antitoxin component YafN of YafNO toxin-antitoxin module